MEPTNVQPTQKQERIQSLDVLRGFAIMGILFMNIQSFSMPGAAYLNPSAYGSLEGINGWAFIFSDLIANTKFISIFSILFGAGIILMTSRLEAKGRPTAGIHYRRNFWLLLFGLAHAYLIWYGDILVSYALIAFWIYFLRKKSPRTLFIIAGILFLVPLMIDMASGLSIPYWSEADYQSTLSMWNPSEDYISKELATYRGGWFGQMESRIDTAIGLQTFIFLILFLWRSSSMMLIGMAFYKLGILSAEKSTAFYRKMMLWGLGLGLPITAYGIYANFKQEWSMEFSMFFGVQYNYIGSVLLAFAYIAIVMLLCKSSAIGFLQKWIAPVGRMALTNYLMQSIICTFIFYGHGLGYYGSVPRIGQLGIMVGVWILQIIYSKYWLDRFKFGPFEWLWRSLTYWKIQKI